MQNEHLTVDEYINYKSFCKMRKNVLRMKYNKIITRWKTPMDWFCDNDKVLSVTAGVDTSNSYWLLWGMLKSQKLPIEFLRNRVMYSSCILAASLKDYQKLEKTLIELKKMYKDAYSERMYNSVLKVCLFKGVNSYSEISLADIEDARKESLFKKNTPYYNLECLSYYMGYNDVAIDRNRYRNNHKVIDLLKRKWSKEMVSIINTFIADLKISKSQGSNKITCLNRYAEWLLLNSDIDIITNLKHFNRDIWYQYIAFTKNIDVSNKSKEAYLCCILQFTDWLEVKRPDIDRKSVV